MCIKNIKEIKKNNKKYCIFIDIIDLYCADMYKIINAMLIVVQ
jgi:hypothetical protein